jgi:hypothetical protein
MNKKVQPMEILTANQPDLQGFNKWLDLKNQTLAF